MTCEKGNLDPKIRPQYSRCFSSAPHALTAAIMKPTREELVYFSIPIIEPLQNNQVHMPNLYVGLLSYCCSRPASSVRQLANQSSRSVGRSKGRAGAKQSPPFSVQDKAGFSRCMKRAVNHCLLVFSTSRSFRRTEKLLMPKIRNERGPVSKITLIFVDHEIRQACFVLCRGWQLSFFRRYTGGGRATITYKESTKLS